jgi:S-adenosylmethionine uptake transporter
MNIVEVVTIFWTIPLFVLVLAAIYLNESISFTRWGATVIGFLGLAFITLYDSGVSFSLKLIYIVPIASAFLFAVQDIMIKKMVVDENRIAMLLYFSIVTSLITFIPAMLVWKTPTSFEFAMLMLLGASANLMQYFLFRAFEATDLSALAPFRYVEFLLSALTAFIFFSEIPGLNVLIGAVILIPSTFYLACNENKKRKEAVA